MKVVTAADFMPVLEPLIEMGYKTLGGILIGAVALLVIVKLIRK